jgi:hypothetical protein
VQCSAITPAQMSQRKAAAKTEVEQRPQLTATVPAGAGEATSAASGAEWADAHTQRLRTAARSSPSCAKSNRTHGEQAVEWRRPTADGPVAAVPGATRPLPTPSHLLPLSSPTSSRHTCAISASIFSVIFFSA